LVLVIGLFAPTILRTDHKDLYLVPRGDGSKGPRRSSEGIGRCDDPVRVKSTAANNLDGFVEILPAVGGRSLAADLVFLDHR
jgi:hypothetical protein